MKTIVSEITGRKDFPIFNTEDEDKIIEFLKQRDWSDFEVNKDDEGNSIIESDENEFGSDEIFKIIDVEVINLD